MANKRATSSTECKCNRVTRKNGSKTYWARGCACMFMGGKDYRHTHQASGLRRSRVLAKDSQPGLLQDTPPGQAILLVTTV